MNDTKTNPAQPSQTSLAIPLEFDPDGQGLGPPEPPGTNWCGDPNHPVVWKDVRLGKKITLNWAGLGSVAKYDTQIQVPNTISPGGAQTPIAFLRAIFTQLYTYEPTINTNQISTCKDGTTKCIGISTTDPKTGVGGCLCPQPGSDGTTCSDIGFPNFVPRGTQSPTFGFGGVIATTATGKPINPSTTAFGLYAENVVDAKCPGATNYINALEAGHEGWCCADLPLSPTQTGELSGAATALSAGITTVPLYKDPNTGKPAIFTRTVYLTSGTLDSAIRSMVSLCKLNTDCLNARKAAGLN